jgi:hypothetical protein
MTVTDDLMGGDWEQGARHLRIAATAIRTTGLGPHLHGLALAAANADREPYLNRLQVLMEKVLKVERELELLGRTVDRVHKEASEFIAAVHVSMTNGHYEPEPGEKRIDGLDDHDEVLERLSDLYGIPKPKEGRR